LMFAAIASVQGRADPKVAKALYDAAIDNPADQFIRMARSLATLAASGDRAALLPLVPMGPGPFFFADVDAMTVIRGDSPAATNFFARPINADIEVSPGQWVGHMQQVGLSSLYNQYARIARGE